MKTSDRALLLRNELSELNTELLAWLDSLKGRDAHYAVVRIEREMSFLEEYIHALRRVGPLPKSGSRGRAHPARVRDCSSNLPT